GWNAELEAASAAQAQAYGAFVGGQFASYDNVVWFLFGDYNPPSHARTSSVKTGISSADSRHTLFAGHYARGDSSHDARESWFTWNYVYPPDVGYMHTELLSAYNASPALPAIMSEGFYEHGAKIDNAEELRRQSWGALTSGACGNFYGSDDVWPAAGPGDTTSGQYQTGQGWSAA